MKGQKSLQQIISKSMMKFITSIAVLLLCFGVYNMYVSYDFFVNDSKQKSISLAKNINVALSFDNLDDINYITNSLDYRNNIHYLKIYNAKSKLFFSKGFTKEKQALTNNQSTFKNFGDKIKISMDEIVIFKNVYFEKEHVGSLEISFTTNFLKDHFFRSIQLFILLIIVFIFMANRTLAVTTEKVVAPLKKFSDKIDEVQRTNNLKLRISNDSFNGVHELNNIFSNFNNLLDVISESKEEIEVSRNNLEQFNQLLELTVEQKTMELNQTIKNLQSYQEKLVAQEKLASLGVLTAGIAHEIRNPLNLINNSALIISDYFKIELLESLSRIEGQLPDNALEEFTSEMRPVFLATDIINKNIKRADTIITNMLKHSRTAAIDQEVFNTKSLVYESYQFSFHSMRATLSLNIEIDLDLNEVGSVNVIESDMSRVITNLLDNSYHSIKYKQEKIGTEYNPKIKFSLTKEDDYAVITIEDNGTGIKKEIREKIMEPFFTTKPPGEGTGLGLSMASDIMIYHNGDLSVESEPGEWARIILKLPIHEKSN